jgi:hypothetical protein
MLAGPAKFVIGAASVLGITALITAIVTFKRADVGLSIFAAILFMIPTMILGIYDINCTVVGDCSFWAWAKGLLFGTWYLACSVLIIVFAITYKKQSASVEITPTVTATVTMSEPETTNTN